MESLEELEAGKQTDQIFQLYEVRGFFWKSTPETNGRTRPKRSKNPSSIMVASQNLWEAHLYIHKHLPNLVPYRITHHGNVLFTEQSKVSSITE